VSVRTCVVGVLRFWVSHRDPTCKSPLTAPAAGDEEDADEAAAAAAAAGGTASAVLHSLLSDAAGISGGGGGDAVAELSEEIGQLVVPRGRYAIEFYPSFMRLVGRTYEFKVAYRSVARMFLLEKPYSVGDAPTRFNFVVALTDPIRQGNQRRPYLIMHLESKGGEFTIPLRVSPEDAAAGRFGGLGAEGRTELTSSDLPKAVATLFKGMTGKPVYRSGDFESAARQKSVRCSVKSSEGLLYPLAKSALFLHKPTQWVPYQDVEFVEFRRSDSAGTGEEEWQREWG
jgi:structure-specific recognition protein 1